MFTREMIAEPRAGGRIRESHGKTLESEGQQVSRLSS